MTTTFTLPRWAAPPREHNPHTRVSLMIGPLMLGAMAYGVLGPVVVPALPLIEGILRTSETGATWLLTVYLLAAAAATAIVGRLGDMFGKRRALMVTLAVLCLGTLISATTSSLALELVGRVLQGVAAGLFPLAFGIIRDELPPEKVAGGIGAVAAMISLGAVGVILPGLILPHASWRWLFWIPMILALLALVGTWWFVRESPVRTGGRVNWFNAGLMMTGITAAVVGISEGSQWGWSSGKTLALILGGLAVSAIWIVAESKSREPLIDISLMRLRSVWSTNIVAFMVGAGMFAAFAVYPIFAELPKTTRFAYGASLLQCGLYLLPFPIVSGLLCLRAGHLVRLLGSVPVLVLGCGIVATGFGYMALWHAHPYDMMISTGLEGLGLGVVIPTMSTVIVQSVPAQNVGEATGMNTVFRMIGGAVGTQIVSSLLTSHHHGKSLPVLSGFTNSYIVLVGFLLVAAIAALIAAYNRADRPIPPQPENVTAFEVL